MIDWRCQSVVERPPAHPSCRPMQQAPGRLAIFTPGRSRLRMARTHIGNTCLYKGLGARDGSRDSPCVFFSGGRSTAQTTIRCGAITFVRFGTHDVGGKGEGGTVVVGICRPLFFPPFFAFIDARHIVDTAPCTRSRPDGIPVACYLP